MSFSCVFMLYLQSDEEPFETTCGRNPLELTSGSLQRCRMAVTPMQRRIAAAKLLLSLTPRGRIANRMPFRKNRHCASYARPKPHRQ
jgi:hypothetical protein